MLWNRKVKSTFMMRYPLVSIIVLVGASLFCCSHAFAQYHSSSPSLSLSSSPRYYLTVEQKEQLTLTLNQMSEQVLSLKEQLAAVKQNAMTCSVALSAAELSLMQCQRKTKEQKRKTRTVLAIAIPAAFLLGAISTTVVVISITK